MSALTANLKHLYQRRAMLVVLAVVVFFNLTGLFATTSPGSAFDVDGLMLIGMIVYWTGGILGSLVGDVWNKPFSFCLPALADSSRRVLLLCTTAIALISSVNFVAHFSHTFTNVLIVSIGIFGFYAMVGFLGVYTTTRFRQGVMFIFALGWLFILISEIPTAAEITETIMMQHSGMMALCFGISCGLIYRSLGQKKHLRKLCAAPWIGFFDLYNIAAYKKLQQPPDGAQKKMMPRHTPIVDKFFTQRMKSTPRFPYIWGRIYLMATATFISGKVLLLIMLLPLIILPLIFSSSDAMSIFYFSAIGGSCGAFCVEGQTNILLPRGRRQKFTTDIMASVIVMITMIILLAGTVILSGILRAVTPDLIVFGKTYHFIPLTASYLFIPILLAPISATSYTLFRKNALRGMIVPIIITCGIMLAVAFQIDEDFRGVSLIGEINWWYVILTCVIFWSAYLTVLYYDSMKRSLC